MDEQRETDIACQLKNGSIDAWNALYEAYNQFHVVTFSLQSKPGRPASKDYRSEKH